MWKIISVILFFSYLFEISTCLTAKDFRQERAKVVYANPKYLTDVHMKTIQTKRNVFVTNITATLVHPWGNNITAVLVYENIKIHNSKVRLDIKICDCFKHNWLKEAILRSTNIKPDCPISAGTVHMYDLELPPRNFPIPFPAGEYHMTFIYMLTKTKEKVGEFEIVLTTINTKSNTRKKSKDG